MEIINIKNLSFAYSSNPTKMILKDINLKINRGEFILLCGPTGCGKTTLIECLNGLIPHFHSGIFEGHVIIGDKDTRDYPVHEFSKYVGLLFQNPENQLVSMNVEKELSFALENFGINPIEIKARVNDVLKIMNIENIRYKAPYDLSGGQQQKVAIASILTLDPEIIIFDEPTSNLDPVGAMKILALISDLNKRYKKTIILIEHRLEMVLRYATKIIVMNDGKIISKGKTEEIIIEDILEKIGLRIPKSVILYKLLKKDGYNLENIPLTPEDLANYLLKLGG
ncbi:MAG: energy-coupling factor ABC transporter ATP-binding protein [Candidatus Helarchaeota archaeon]